MLFAITLFGSGGLDQTCIGPNQIILLIQTVIKVALALVGAVAIIYIVWAGIRYMMAGGEEAAMNVAKKSIQWSVIGLLVVILSNMLVGFVATQVLNSNTSGVKITNNAWSGPVISSETLGSWCTGSTTTTNTTIPPPAQ